MAVSQSVHEIVRQALDGEGVEIVEIQLKGTPGRQLLRVFVDSDDGINLDRCAELSRKISDLMDRKDPIPGRYTLEVSSPGTDRPLRTERDFRRNIGRVLRVTMAKDREGEIVVGTLRKVEPQVLFVEEQGNTVTIPIDAIRTAKIKLRW